MSASYYQSLTPAASATFFQLQASKGGADHGLAGWDMLANFETLKEATNALAIEARRQHEVPRYVQPARDLRVVEVAVKIQVLA